MTRTKNQMRWAEFKDIMGAVGVVLVMVLAILAVTVPYVYLRLECLNGNINACLLVR